MSGLEVRVGYGEHKVVEKFLAADPAGVTGVQLNGKYVRHCEELAEAARAADLEVTVEPLTERLTTPGFNPGGLPYGDLYPIDLGLLERSAPARMELVEAVIAPRVELVTAVVPPHFFVENSEDLGLTVALVRACVAEYGDDRPVRPILAIQRQFLTDGGGVEAVAARYVQAGIDTLEIRVSPLGGHDEGPTKIRKVFAALERLQAAGLEIRLGSSGLIGHSALALGIATGFSVGVGYGEKFSHKETMRRQRVLAAAEEAGDETDDEGEDDGPRGAQAMVWLPGTQMAIARRTARELYSDPRIRSQLSCPRGHCALALDGPITDVRRHYLHSWAGEVSETLGQPEAWRSTLLRERLRKAEAFREVVWEYLPTDTARPKTGTLDTLIGEIDRRVQRAA